MPTALLPPGIIAMPVPDHVAPLRRRSGVLLRPPCAIRSQRNRPMSGLLNSFRQDVRPATPPRISGSPPPFARAQRCIAETPGHASTPHDRWGLPCCPAHLPFPPLPCAQFHPHPAQQTLDLRRRPHSS